MSHPFDSPSTLLRTLRHSLTANLMLLTVAFVWGVTFVFVKTALGEIGSFTFLVARFWLAFAVLAVPFLGTRLRRPHRLLCPG